MAIKETENKTKNKKDIYQFRIDVKGAKPPIWRRVLVEKTSSFHELHAIIQNTLGWDNSHLHQFEIDNETIIADTANEYHEPSYEKEYDEFKTKISKFFKEEGDSMEYLYDFGDNWMHSIKLEKIIERDINRSYPFVVTGKRRGPLEDCGGIYYYNDICSIIKDPKHPEHEEFIENFGYFDAEEFEKEDIDFLNNFFKYWNDEEQE